MPVSYETRATDMPSLFQLWYLCRTVSQDAVHTVNACISVMLGLTQPSKGLAVFIVAHRQSQDVNLHRTRNHSDIKETNSLRHVSTQMSSATVVISLIYSHHHIK